MKRAVSSSRRTQAIFSSEFKAAISLLKVRIFFSSVLNLMLGNTLMDFVFSLVCIFTFPYWTCVPGRGAERVETRLNCLRKRRGILLSGIDIKSNAHVRTGITVHRHKGFRGGGWITDWMLSVLPSVGCYPTKVALHVVPETHPRQTNLTVSGQSAH